MYPFSLGKFEASAATLMFLFNGTGECADYWLLDYLGNFFN